MLIKNLFIPIAFCFASVILHAQKLTGLLGAFPPELVLLQQQLTQKSDTIIQHIRFTKGLLNGRFVVLAQTGVGKVNAAITTTLMIAYFKPEQIIFSGIAGGIDTTLSPGDIVIATQVAYHDYGMITDSGMRYNPTRNPATMQPNPVYFACDTTLINKAIVATKKLTLEKVTREEGVFVPQIKKGIVVTGDVFVAGETQTHRLLNDLHATATEMEGAAIAQTCYQQNIPFLIIRSLSDKANSKAATDIKAFYEVAAKNAAMLVVGIVGELGR